MTSILKERSEEFLKYLRFVKNSSPHTIRSYAQDLAAFVRFLEQEKIVLESLEEVDKKVVRQFLAFIYLEKVSKRTLVRKISCLKSFFKFLKKEKKIARNPMEEIEGPKLPKTLPKALSYEQVEQLMQQPDIDEYLGFRDRCIMELLYSSGLRISELAALNRSSFDFASQQVLVEGKRKKQRLLPVTASALKWIKEYLEHPARQVDGSKHFAEKDPKALFLNKWGKRITVRSLDRNFLKYLVSSGLPLHVTPHTIRHTIATHWLENGMDLETIQTLLGHEGLVTTTIYTKVSTTLKRQVYDAAHPLAKQ